MRFPIDPPQMPRDYTNTIPEHEVLLSFRNDSDSEVFLDWWKAEGLNLFMEWVAENVGY